MTLSLPSGGATLGIQSSTTVTIIENDLPQRGTLQFQLASYSIAENGASVTAVVTRAGGSDGMVSVDYATVDGTASASTDYTPAIGTLTFADGDAASKTITLVILDDAIYEGDEVFVINLNNVTGGATLGPQFSSNITILEDDPTPPAGSLQFSFAVYNIDENTASLAVTVTRVGGDFGTVTVDYGTADDTANAALDYTAASGTLTFGDGDATSKTFAIPVLDDDLYEGDETLIVSLSNVTGGASLGTQQQATVTIVENELVPVRGYFQFSAVTYYVLEDSVVATITVNRIGGDAGLVRLDYNTVDGSASAGTDYLPAIGTLRFENREVSKTIDITILDDSVYEGDETFSIRLSNLRGGKHYWVNQACLLLLSLKMIPVRFQEVCDSVAQAIALRMMKIWSR